MISEFIINTAASLSTVPVAKVWFATTKPPQGHRHYCPWYMVFESKPRYYGRERIAQHLCYIYLFKSTEVVWYQANGGRYNDYGVNE